MVKSILVKRLQTPGYFADVYLVMQNGQYEAALFINDKYKPGPPIPYPLDKPTDEVTHWMGVRPSVGLSPEEADRIISEVEGENAIHRKRSGSLEQERQPVGLFRLDFFKPAW